MNTFHSLPDDLKHLDRWLLWKVEQRKGKSTKVPYQANDNLASSTDASTWTTFGKAVAAFERGGFAGLGLVFNGDGIIGVDLDKVIDEAGNIEPWAGEIVRRLDSYTEISPSGRGVHVIVRATMPAGGNRRDAVEIYATGRYFTMTGNRWEGTPATVERRDAELAEAHAQHVARPAAKAKPTRLPKASGGQEAKQKATADGGGGRLVLRADAQPPAGKLLALIENDRQFKASWNRKRLDSDSERDLSLASIAARCGWSKQEVADLVIAFRRDQCKDVAKALREDIIAGLFAKAFAEVDAECEADGGDPLALISSMLCVEVERVKRIGSEDPTFEVHTKDGRKLDVEGPDTLLSGAKLQKTMMACGVMIRRHQTKKLEKLGQALLTVTEVVELPSRADVLTEHLRKFTDVTWMQLIKQECDSRPRTGPEAAGR